MSAALRSFTGVRRVLVTSPDHRLVGRTGLVYRLRRCDNGAWVRMDDTVPDDFRSFPEADERARDVILFPEDCASVDGPATNGSARATNDVAMTHPAHRAVHAVNNALQILVGFSQRHALQALQMDAADVRRLLEDVPADIAAIHQCNERLEEDLRGLRDQGLEDAREITRLRRAIAMEQQEREGLLLAIEESLGSLSEVHRQANRMRAAGARRDVPPTITHESPRIAATGA